MTFIYSNSGQYTILKYKVYNTNHIGCIDCDFQVLDSNKIVCLFVTNMCKWITLLFERQLNMILKIQAQKIWICF